MPFIASLLMKIGADTSGMQSAIGGVETAANSAGKIIGGMGVIATGAGAAVLGGMMAAKSAMQGFVDAASEGQERGAQLRAVLASTGNAAGYTEAELNKLGFQLMRVTKFDDEAWQASQTLMLGFTHIGKEVFPRAEQAAADLATRMGMDLSSASRMVGLALENPERGMARLRAMQIVLTDEQRKNIKTFQDQGDIMKAQGVILDAMSQKFGGSAAASMNTYAGAMAVLRNEQEAVREAIGGALIPAFTDLVKWMGQGTATIAEKLTPAMEKFAPFLQERAQNVMYLAEVFRDHLKPGIDAVIKMFVSLGDTLTKNDAWTNLTAHLSDAAMAIGDTFSNAMKTIIPMVKDLWPTIQSLGQSFMALLPILNPVGTLFKELLPTIVQLLPPIAQVANVVASTLSQAFVGLLASLAGVVREMLPPLLSLFQKLVPVVVEIIPVVGNLASLLADILAGSVGDLIVVLAEAVQNVLPSFMQFFRALEPVIWELVPVISDLALMLAETLGGALQQILPMIMSFAQRVLPPLIDALARIMSALSPIIPMIGKFLARALEVAMPFLNQLAHALELILPPVIELAEPLLDVASAILDAILPVLQPMIQYFIDLVPLVASLAETLAVVLKPILEAVAWLIKNVVAPVLQWFMGIVWGIRDAIVNFLTTVLGGIFDLASKIPGPIGDAAKQLKQHLDQMKSDAKVTTEAMNTQVDDTLKDGTHSWDTTLSGGMTKLNETFKIGTDGIVTTMKDLNEQILVETDAGRKALLLQQSVSQDIELYNLRAQRDKLLKEYEGATDDATRQAKIKAANQIQAQIDEKFGVSQQLGQQAADVTAKYGSMSQSAQGITSQMATETGKDFASMALDAGTNSEAAKKDVIKWWGDMQYLYLSILYNMEDQATRRSMATWQNYMAWVKKLRDDANAAWGAMRGPPGFGIISIGGNYGRPLPTGSYNISQFPNPRHVAIDLAAPQGTPVIAAASGRIAWEGQDFAGANAIREDVGGGLQLLYWHQLRNLVNAGQSVGRGQTIGLVGSTGISTGPHLHFEARQNDVAFDPRRLLSFEQGGWIREPVYGIGQHSGRGYSFAEREQEYVSTEGPGSSRRIARDAPYIGTMIIQPQQSTVDAEDIAAIARRESLRWWGG